MYCKSYNLDSLQLTNSKDQKLLHQLGIQSNSLISIKTTSSNGASASVASSVADDEVSVADNLNLKIMNLRKLHNLTHMLNRLISQN